ncbi:MAG TPA: hypothetical protein VFE22_15965 [Edaphobacter sp.]|nr:hypothetical protein [Edaphobacter sp.]
MSCPVHLSAAFNSVGRLRRKVRRTKRFDRAKASLPLYRRVREYWTDGLDALFSYLSQDDGWDKIQRHCQVALAAEQFAKALSDSDRKFLQDLLAKFGFYNDVTSQATAIVKATSFDTFEEAATFALQKLGIESADFELRNERIRDLLLDRKSAAVFATRTSADAALDTVISNFYELGRNPYNQEFLDGLRKDLGYRADWEAKRFALTETGIAAELAQVETYRRNGIERKRWNILGQNTRPTHAELAGVEVAIGEKFDVGGFEADHPLDPNLPPEELVNCHCWLSPVVDDDYQIDPSKIWEGQ